MAASLPRRPALQGEQCGLRSSARKPRAPVFPSPLSRPPPRFPHLSNGAHNRPTHVTAAGPRSRKGRERPARNCGQADGAISNPLRRGSVRKWSPCSFLSARVIMPCHGLGLRGRSWRKSPPSHLEETHPAGGPLAGSTCSGHWDFVAPKPVYWIANGRLATQIRE